MDFFRKKIPIKRRCRQGDPLSPYLFILCVELLGSLVNNDETIHGIDIGDKCFKLVQYADDTSFFIHGDVTSSNRVMTQLQYFSTLSGLKLSLSISFLVGLGNLKGSFIDLNSECNIPWICGEDFKLLGIVFNTDLRSMTNKNCENAMHKVLNVTKLWEKRNLTVLGCIAVVKSLLVPCFNYYIKALHCPQQSI